MACFLLKKNSNRKKKLIRALWTPPPGIIGLRKEDYLIKDGHLKKDNDLKKEHDLKKEDNLKKEDDLQKQRTLKTRRWPKKEDNLKIP